MNEASSSAFFASSVQRPRQMKRKRKQREGFAFSFLTQVQTWPQKKRKEKKGKVLHFLLSQVQTWPHHPVTWPGLETKRGRSSCRVANVKPWWISLPNTICQILHQIPKSNQLKTQQIPYTPRGGSTHYPKVLGQNHKIKSIDSTSLDNSLQCLNLKQITQIPQWYDVYSCSVMMQA